MDGRVEGIYLAAVATEPLHFVPQAKAVPGRGLEGDRYFEGVGTYTGYDETGEALTLIEAEAIEALPSEDGIVLSPEQTRRNVVTRGISLNDLVGKRFRIGPVECRGVRLCEPCAHLEGLTQPGVLEALVHRGGLNADILTEGEIAVGDAIVPLQAAEPRP